MWQPKVLNPVPDPFFVRELRLIDSDLRVVWGMERYLKNSWAIERKMPAERYFTAYESILSGNEPRFVEQPIFDTNQPETDENGDLISYRQVGTRQYDLAPEYEWVAFADKVDTALLATIRRLYWERDHPEATTAASEQEKLDVTAAKKKKRLDAGMEGVDEAFLAARKRVQFGRGKHRSENQ